MNWKSRIKLPLFILALLLPVSVFAQIEITTEKVNALLYFQNLQYDKCIEIADDLISDNKAVYSKEEYYLIAMGAVSCFISNEPDKDKVKQMTEIAKSGLSISFNEEKEKLNSLDKEGKKEYILGFVEKYQMITELYVLSDDTENEQFKRLISFFHDYIYPNRVLFDVNDNEEASIFICLLNCEAQTIFYTNVFSNIVDLIKETFNLKITNNTFTNSALYQVLLSYYPFVLTLLEFDSNGYFLDDVINYYLRLNECNLFVNGHKQSKNYSSLNWKDIQKELTNKECAVFVYWSDDEVLKCFSFSNNSGIRQGIITLSDYTSVHQQLMDHLRLYYPLCNKFYICPSFFLDNIDIANDCDSVYLKYSLSDLIYNEEKEKNYNDGVISIFADIDYGSSQLDKSNDYPLLNDGKIIIQTVKELYGDKAYALFGNRVNKINFLNINEDVDILHVSTHGIINNNDINRDNYLDSYLSNTLMSGYVLALSNYNVNPEENSISANDIKQITFNRHSLVYLDACETARSGKHIMGSFSLARSFYLSGASTIIAYLKPIEESIATDFALAFYKELYNSTTKNYHDVFYRVKQEMIKKYGNDRIQIVMWE